MSGSSHDAYMKGVFQFDVVAYAGAAKGGSASPSKPSNTDEKQASARGAQIGQALKKGALSADAKAELMQLLQFYKDEAFESFVRQIGLESNRLSNEYESGDLIDHGDWVSSNETMIIIPTAEATVDRGGFTVAYAAQISEVTTESTSVTIYTDYSASAGVTVNIPIKKIVTISFGAKATHGKMESETTQKSNSQGRTQTISRSFRVKHMQRETIKWTGKKTYYGEGSFAKKVTHEMSGLGPELQHGYMVEPVEGGPPWGPFWDTSPREARNNGTALDQAWAVLTKEQQQIAKDLVFGGGA